MHPYYNKNHASVTMNKCKNIISYQNNCQKLPTIYTKNTNNYNKINTYLQHFITSPKIYENTKLVANLCNILDMLFKQKIVQVCYIFKKVVHGRPDLDKNIVILYMLSLQKSYTFITKITIVYNIE
jgi:hypothetical protein